jgi:hypothetical protein
MAADDVYNVWHDHTLTVPAAGVPGLLANDLDPDPQAAAHGHTGLKVSGHTDVAHGTLTLTANDGSFTYTPAAGYSGPDNFSYQITDGNPQGFALSRWARVALNVLPNHPPVARDWTIAVTRGQVTDIRLPSGLLVNGDSYDLDYDGLTPRLVNGPAGVTISALGEVHIPALQAGTSFTYKLNDGYADSNTGTVTVVVINSQADEPRHAQDHNYILAHDRTLQVTGLSSTGDAVGILYGGPGTPGGDYLCPNPYGPFTVSVVRPPANGQVSRLTTGGFRYTPNRGVVGADSFTYQIQDPGGVSNVATVGLFVEDRAPLAEDDTYQVLENSPLSGNVTTNDRDALHDTLTATLVAGPSHGTLVGGLGANGQFTYHPALGYYGTDSFTYKVNDGVPGEGDSNVATVWVTVRSGFSWDIQVTGDPTTATGVTFSATYQPGTLVTAASRVTFLQVITGRTRGGRESFPEADPAYYRQYSTGAGLGDFLDHLEGETDPYYGAQWAQPVSGGPPYWEDEGATGTVGKADLSGTSPATMADSPNSRAARTLGGAVVTFETAAFCIDSQEVLGVLTWGYNVPADPAVGPPAPLQLLNGQDGDFGTAASAHFKALIAKANAIYDPADPDKASAMEYAQLNSDPLVSGPKANLFAGTSAL